MSFWRIDFSINRCFRGSLRSAAIALSATLPVKQSPWRETMFWYYELRSRSHISAPWLRPQALWNGNTHTYLYAYRLIYIYMWGWYTTIIKYTTSMYILTMYTDGHRIGTGSSIHHNRYYAFSHFVRHFLSSCENVERSTETTPRRYFRTR